MINTIVGSKRIALLTFLIGASLSYEINYLMVDQSDQGLKILSLENTIKNLEASLSQKDAELNNLRLGALRQNGQNKISNAGATTEIFKQVSDSERAIAAAIPSSVLVLKDLETMSDSDHRSYSEKLNELLSGNASKERIAIASRAIFDMAHDQQNLPDSTLQSIYASQADPDLKRVIAQVLSQRGNNSLLYNQIAEVQGRLKSEHPGDRQEALSQLAKMHSTKAVDAIVPLLQDPDTNVKLEALFALRDTGNQGHVGFVEMMINDPDPSVRSLAGDVVSNLKNLSSTARTNYSRADIEAELPPIANP